jgi:hypothetical protein
MLSLLSKVQCATLNNVFILLSSVCLSMWAKLKLSLLALGWGTPWLYLKVHMNERTLLDNVMTERLHIIYVAIDSDDSLRSSN